MHKENPKASSSRGNQKSNNSNEESIVKRINDMINRPVRNYKNPPELDSFYNNILEYDNENETRTDAPNHWYFVPKVGSSVGRQVYANHPLGQYTRMRYPNNPDLKIKDAVPILEVSPSSPQKTAAKPTPDDLGYPQMTNEDFWLYAGKDYDTLDRILASHLSHFRVNKENPALAGSPIETAKSIVNLNPEGRKEKMQRKKTLSSIMQNFVCTGPISFHRAFLTSDPIKSMVSGFRGPINAYTATKLYDKKFTVGDFSVYSINQISELELIPNKNQDANNNFFNDDFSISSINLASETDDVHNSNQKTNQNANRNTSVNDWRYMLTIEVPKGKSINAIPIGGLSAQVILDASQKFTTKSVRHDWDNSVVFITCEVD